MGLFWYLQKIDFIHVVLQYYKWIINLENPMHTNQNYRRHDDSAHWLVVLARLFCAGAMLSASIMLSYTMYLFMTGNAKAYEHLTQGLILVGVMLLSFFFRWAVGKLSPQR